MRLALGGRLGSYEIRAPLGAGGMGEVYRARDTRLGRDVAIKVIPERFLRDADRLARFEREARLLAALNHPNVAAIYGIAEEDGIHALVLELVEGESLDETLASRGLTVDDALRIARNVASGLEAAHEKGIVHRDLKPSNIRITPDGTVKILDFGLAKSVMDDAPEAGADGSPTVTSNGTQAGTILGTVAYMSPEQARGKPVDKRTDIWAFGCVLYELLAGRRAFGGETMSDTIAAILDREPDWSAIPNAVSPQVARLLRRCLEKDAKRRLRDVGEAAYELAQPPAPDTSSAARPRVALQKVWRWGFILAALGIAAAVVVIGWSARSRTSGSTAPRSLAVLPLRSVGAESGDYLGMGVTADVITKVSHIREMTVRPASAIRKYAGQDVDGLEAGRELGVDSILEGTVQRDGSRVRVNVNLLGVRDGKSIWSDTFDVDATSIFDIQDRLSRTIATQLRVQLTPQESGLLNKQYTSNSAAYEHYLRGNLLLDQRSVNASDRTLEQGISSFRAAIDADPGYALAHAGLAYSYAWMALFNDPGDPKWIQMARDALSRSLALDPQLPRAHVVRFEILYSRYGGFDIAEGLKELRLAQELDRTAGLVELASLYAHIGLADQSIELTERLIEIDPTSGTAKSRYIENRVLLGRYDDALAAATRFNWWNSNDRTVLAFLAKNDFGPAERAIAAELEVHPRDHFMLSSRVLLDALRGRTDRIHADARATEQFAEGSRATHHTAYNLACAYAVVGRTKEAVQWLRKTVDTGMPNYPLFATERHFQPLRNEPPFIEFMAQLKSRWQELRRLALS